jgi:HK97 family phage prohead protease
MNKKEYRFLTQDLRATGTDAKPKIQGYAARYNVKTQLQPGLREVIRPGAFRKTVAAKDDCYACFNHDEQQILGRVRAGSLRLKEDSDGLYFDCDIDTGVSYASDLYRNIKSGAISECSFGFYALNDDYVADDEDSSEVLRELKECQVFDVSPVVMPQYSNTSVSARSRAMFPDGIPTDLERRFKSARAAEVVAASVEVSERDLAHARARLEFAKRLS